MDFRTLSYFLPLALLLFSCDEAPTPSTGSNPAAATAAAPEETVVPEAVSTGKVINTFVTGNPTEAFTVYAPTATAAKAAPLLIAFDPQGEGEKQVRYYQALADRHGFILVGSDYSQNGMVASDYQNHAAELLKDLPARLNVDQDKIYVAGFSGGSTVALNAAQEQPSVRGVIGCGSPYNQLTNNSGKNAFHYVGIVGHADFNFWNQVVLDSALAQWNYSHLLLHFEGGHEWPHPATMEKAIRYLRIRDGWADNDELENWAAEEMQEVYRLKEKGPIGDLARQLNYVTTTYASLPGREGLLNDYQAFKSISAFRSWDEFTLQMGEFEAQAQNAYQSAFTTRDLDWWKEETTKIVKDTANRDLRVEERRMNKRLLSYLSLVSYLQAAGQINQNLLDEADKSLSIYEWVDGDNPEHAYLRAIWLVKNDNPGAAVASLRKAVDLGFVDVERLLTEPDFAELDQEKGWEQVLQQMQDNL